MDKLKIIFLDFDGVISTPDYCMNLEPEKVRLVENLVTETSAKIVVTSTWAVGCQNVNEFLIKTFGEKWNTCIYQDFVNAIYDIINIIEYGEYDRGGSIEKWLDSHDGEIESFVIIDDICDFGDDLLFNFVQTDDQEGITSREVKLAKKVLNHERIQKPTRLNNELMFKQYEKYAGRSSNIDQLLSDYFYSLRNK